MGNSPPVFDNQAEKGKLEINCFKIKGYLEISREKKLNQAHAKEKILIKDITSPNRSRQDEIEKASIIITHLNYVKACNILIRYSELIRDNSLNIIENHKEIQKIVDLIPFVETILWSAKYMGIESLQEFQEYILYLFGKEFLESVEKNQRVDPEIKKCFENIVPTPIEINEYFVDLAIRTNIPLEKINEIGHEFAKTGGSPPFNGPSNGGQNNYFNNLVNLCNDNNGRTYQQNDANFTKNNENFQNNNFNTTQNYPNNLMNNNNNMIGPKGQTPGDNPTGNNENPGGGLPNLDEFEERLRKLKGN